MTSPSSSVDSIAKAMEGVTRFANSHNPNGLGFSNGITEDENGGYVRYDAYQDLARQAEAMKRRAEAAEALAERLKLEAQAHAMEARTANSTINEIYQVVSGGKGEPGNWHGAQPVREKLEAMKRGIAELRLGLNEIATDEEYRDLSAEEAKDMAKATLHRARSLIGGGNAE